MSSFANIMISDGLLPLVILGLVALEAVALTVLRRRFGIGPGFAPMAGSLLSGAFLVAALYVALVGGAAELILLCLAASFAVHLGDLAWRMHATRTRSGETALPQRKDGLHAQGSV